MARPRKHYGKWRIRWVDEHRGRHSETFDTFDEAVFAQQKHELEVKEIKRGLRGASSPTRRSATSATTGSSGASPRSAAPRTTGASSRWAPRFRKARIPVLSKDSCYLRTKEEGARVLRFAKAEGELSYAFYVAAI